MLKMFRFVERIRVSIVHGGHPMTCVARRRGFPHGKDNA